MKALGSDIWFNFSVTLWTVTRECSWGSELSSLGPHLNPINLQSVNQPIPKVQKGGAAFWETWEE